MKSYKAITKDNTVTDVRNVEVEIIDTVSTSTTTTITHINAEIKALNEKLAGWCSLKTSVFDSAKVVKLKVEKEEVKKHV